MNLKTTPLIIQGGLTKKMIILNSMMGAIGIYMVDDL